MSVQAHCRACREAMTEGRAYELGNHRWHIKCFRCSTCNDQLTAHTNMLVLGDGTLVCANCSYTCVVCTKKITDMAVLTNDQAFCATCFVCRNCKKTIDDLQYARTSQGIFCMDCHTALMARKQQKIQQKLNFLKQRGEFQFDNSEQSTQTYQRSPNESHSGVESSKSSLASSTSINRNKELPDLPMENSHKTSDSHLESKGSTFPDIPSGSSSVPSQGPVNQPETKGKRLKVPRKQLAPSAFNILDDSRSDFSSSQVSIISDVTPVDYDVGTVSRSAKSGPSTQSSVDDTMDEVLAPLQDSFAISSLKTPVSTPIKNRKNDWGGQTTPEITRNGTNLGSPPAITTPRAMTSKSGVSQELLGAGSMTGVAMNVPQRSQLRAVSPARTGLDRSPTTASPQFAYQFTQNSHNIQSPHYKKPAPPPVPVDRGPLSTASPTQAAAPQQTPNSPFNRWWHKRDASVSSTKSTDSSYVPISTVLTNHKRSLSENEKRNSNTYEQPQINDRLNEALEALSLERQRSAEAEVQIRQLRAEQRSLKGRENLLAEITSLESQLARLREEYKIQTSRNNQLKEMNAELERQTLEKFGPKSLWGSQNPHPNEVLSTNNGAFSASHISSTTKDVSKDLTMVTKLDDPQQFGINNSNGTNHAQFLPLKSAKQWFFRRPNRPGQVNQVSIGQPNNSNSGSSATSYTNLQDANKNSKSSGLNNNKELGLKQSEVSGLLGETLAHRVQIDQAEVPYFVTRCFAEIEKRGINTEGIYRKPGSKSQVDAILQQFGEEGDPRLGEELLGGEIQAVTSAVKQYLRKLDEPVITYDCYESFVAAGNSRNIDDLMKTLQKLPIEHLSTLRAIILHLALVASHDKQNLMNIRNLAMVFAPTICRDLTGEREIPDMQARNEATQMLIINVNALFGNVDELL